MENILANRIKARLAALNMNATQAALKSDLGKTAVRDIIAGKSKSPTVDTLGRLASTLQCTVSYLLGDVEDPQRFRPSDQEITDIQVADVIGLLREGVFQSPPKKAVSYGKNLMYGHPIAPEHRLWLYKMGDDSMAGVGILQNDIVTVAMPYDQGEFQLHAHKFVVSIRMIVTPSLEEISLREVVVEDGETKLTTRPTSGAPDVIELAKRIEVKDRGHLYSTVEDHGIVINGFVLRVTRDIPDL